MRVLLIAALAAAAATNAIADWPQFLGPGRDGVATGETIAAKFPDGEPEIVWKKDIGHGFAGPIVSDDKVYLFHRRDDRAVLDAFNAATGAEVWSFGYATDYRDDFGFDDGPRAVPLAADGKVFIYGAEGKLHCVTAAKGELVWAKDLRAEFKAEKGFFGRAPSPLLAAGTLVMQIGGDAAGLVGLDPATGKERWKATTHEAGYASPVAATIDGKLRVLAFTRDGFVCLDPNSGKVLIEKKHRAAMHASVNAASPLFFAPNQVFISACYNVGAALWKLAPDAPSLTPVWAAGERLDCHYATPVRFKNHLIGFHGRQETGTILRCIDAMTGEVAWSSARLPAGSVTLAGESLIVLTERGELILAKADTTGFKPAARGQILANGTRALPALCDGRLYARDTRKLVCVKLR